MTHHRGNRWRVPARIPTGAGGAIARRCAVIARRPIIVGMVRKNTPHAHR